MKKRVIILLLILMPVLPMHAQAVFTDSIPTDTVLLDDGSLYMGQISDSLFNGKGLCIYPDGTVYDGEWKDGLWEGNGTLVYPDGDIYKGAFHEHRKEGLGTYIYNSGARYDGEWKDDRFNGKGKLRFEDGGLYDGSWKDEMKHGYGKLITSEGKTITGYFYYDEYLGLPFDTTIDRDSTLTDELKEWGFKSEPDSIPADLSVGFSISMKKFAALSLWFELAEHFFFGFSAGLNIDPPTHGKYGGMGWNAVPRDIHMEGEYVSTIYTLESGVKWKKMALGGGAGIGFNKAYQNCRANDPTMYYGSVIKYGDAYYTDLSTSGLFVYRVYARRPIYIKKQPKALVYLGYGNIEGVFLGVGLYY